MDTGSGEPLVGIHVSNERIFLQQFVQEDSKLQEISQKIDFHII